MATQHPVRTQQQRSMAAVAFGILATVALIGGLIVAQRQPVALPNRAPVVAPAARPNTNNRPFLDEIAGADT